MPFPDLTPARTALAKLMSDACTITDDPEGGGDDAMDPVTLEIVTPPADAKTLYTGQCMVSPGSASTGEIGGQTVESQEAHVRIPATAPVIPVGARVTITASERDPQLVGQVMRVYAVDARTLLVARHLHCTILSRVAP